MIWSDMSYHKFEHYFEEENDDNEENKMLKEELHEFNQTNSFIFNRYKCIL